MHHTAENTAHTAAQVPSILAAMYAFHTGPKGWHDIAYNFLVDREGGVWEGRAGSLAGPVAADATGGSQGFDQLVCFIGDFTSVTPTPAALDAGNRTLAWLAQRYSIDTSAGAKVTFVSRGSNKWPAGAQVTTSTIAGPPRDVDDGMPGQRVLSLRAQPDAGRGARAARGGVPPAPVTAAATTAPPATARAARPPPTTTTQPATTTTQPATTTTLPSTTTTTQPTTTDHTPATTSTGQPATTSAAPARGEAAPANKGGDGGLPAAIPIAAATAAAGGALLWLRQRAQRADDADDPSEPT